MPLIQRKKKTKRLLKPPAENEEVFFLPNSGEFLKPIRENSLVGVCHQPDFFNPSASLKFLFLDNIPIGKKKFIFLDTNKVRLRVKIPFSDGSARSKYFINGDKVLCDYLTPEAEYFDEFFAFLEESLRNCSLESTKGALSNLLKFREIIFGNIKRKYLREVLVESFLEFYGIDSEYCFFSDFLESEDFKKFFIEIYRDAGTFREIFNDVLVEYKKEYKFSYKNYPYPPLKEEELPFWIVENGLRRRCFTDDIKKTEAGNLRLFPRTAALMCFLRLHELDFIIHGTEGTNCEWMNDRLVERFFKQDSAPYAALSGTFLLDDLKEKEFPYFFFDSQKIKEKVQEFF